MSKQQEASQYASGSYIAQARDGSTATINVYNYENAPPALVEDAILATAQEQLAKLPLDEIPGPAQLPDGSLMPFRRNRSFVGREDELKTLAASFKASENMAIVAVTGLGGLGKTQLASEVVHRYGQYFSGGVYWLSFADASAVPAEVAECGRVGKTRLGLDSDYFNALDLQEQVREVMSAWQSALPRLLVFDNCEDEELLDQWAPPIGGCRVLVTSRRVRWDPTLVQALPLETLSRDESVELLRKYRPFSPAEGPELDAIASELGDLPLALQLAGNYLRELRYELTPGDYLNQLRHPDILQHLSMQDGGVSLTKHEQNVARTFSLSYEQLDAAAQTDELAVELLVRAAYFAPGEPIPRDLLHSTVDIAGDAPDIAVRVGRALGRLVDLGLLETQEAGALKMHRLLVAFVREVASDNEAQAAVEGALLNRVSNLLNEGHPLRLLGLQPHLRAVTDVAKGREDERAAFLCDYLGRHLLTVGEYVEARPYLERAVVVHEKTVGEEHPYTAMSLNNLAMLLQEQGQYEQVRPYLERVLAINEKTVGEEHPYTATTLNNLAYLLQEQGQYEQARPYLERALAINKKTVGEEHPYTITTLNNLASLLEHQGEYEDARPLFEWSLAICEKVLGEEHPYTTMSLNNLAMLLREQGQYEQARPYLERALAIDEKVLGDDHPNIATSLNNLAMLLREQGQYEQVRPYLERALAIREKTVGEEHPYTAVTLSNIAMLLKDQGEYEDARLLYERSLAIYEKVFGEDHSDTATILRNLAMLLQAQGEYEQARPLYERAVAVYEKALGAEHPYTEETRQSLASLEK